MSMELREDARRREQEITARREERERRARDLRAVAALPEGARLLRRLLRDGGIFRPDYLPGIPGAYRAGKKAAALDLWRDLRDCLPAEIFIDIALAADAAPGDHAAASPGRDPDDRRRDIL